jgi:hypothetical protein
MKTEGQDQMTECGAISEGSLIPALPDIMDDIERRFLDGVAKGAMHQDLAASISEAMVNGTNGDLFPFLALARGCHAAAEANRQEGNTPAADFLHSIGQHLLSQAVHTLAGLMVLDVHLSGIARH